MRNILAEYFCIETRVLVQVVAEGERLLATVTASTPGLTVSLHQRAVYDDIQNAVGPIMML